MDTKDLDEMEMYEIQSGQPGDQNTYLIMPRTVNFEDFVNNDCIQIIDEDGEETNYTIDNFINIFDSQGLEGFIL